MDLVVREVSKRYGNGVQALDAVTLTIPPGLYGLLGPNGAGKTTLMNTLATLQEPDSGSISIGHLDLRTSKQEVRQQLGYLPQEFGVYAGMSATALLDYLALLKGVSDRVERKKHVAALLELVNLSTTAHRAVDSYSGGMRQRFGIAQALLGNPRLVIVDEPTAGLDPAERTRFHEILANIASGTIVLLSTHIVEDIANLCKRVAVLNGGRVRAEGSPQALAEALRGRLWMRPLDIAVEPSAIPRVLNRSFHAGQLWVTVMSETTPGEGFRAKEPTLEDAYFHAIQTE